MGCPEAIRALSSGAGSWELGAGSWELADGRGSCGAAHQTSVHQIAAALPERQQVDDGIEWSRSIGVTAVPTFVFDDQYGIVGAQDYDVFKAMMEKLVRKPKTATK